MINKKIILVFFLTFSGLLYFITPTRAATQTKTILPSQDTYINSNYPNTNYGSDDYLYVGGWSGGFCVSMIQFRRSDLPGNIQEISLRIYVILWIETVPVTIYTSPDAWNENTLTYSNSPGPGGGDLIGVIDLTVPMEWKLTFPNLDLTTRFPEGSDMTFALVAAQSYLLSLASSEHATETPALLVDYTVTESNLPLIIGLVVGIGAAIGVGAIGAIIYVKRKKKGRIQKDIEKPETKKPSIPTEKFCSKCGADVTTALGKFCPSCGTEIT